MTKATEDNNPKVNDYPTPDSTPKSTPPFIQIFCQTSGKNTRFAPGTKAGFALTFMNNKLIQIQTKTRTHLPFSSHIESVKDGEEPIVFGPTATLVDFGHGWKLMSVSDKKEIDKGLFGDSDLKNTTSTQEISFVYLGKILVSFVLIFLFGALCTLFLENLPQLILYIGQLT
ncbi:hypothetical protein Leryth_019095 [Lithospermum erythrorhizon]|nr:hypothetical protein Leryth_019095 [Lithospermum erythrorhizon]